MEKKVHNLSQKSETNKKGTSKKKITIEVDEDDSCFNKKDVIPEEKKGEIEFKFSPGNDPRFQQQNQTQRCYVMYTDFYRCEHILGEGTEACKWFKEVFTSICPTFWVERWDELRATNRFAWHKGKTQGPFPGTKYGE